MINVIELISGQSFESMKLASEYFKIPISVVTTSIKSGLKLEFEKKEYKFVKRKVSMITSTTTAKPVTTFPFGKYKNQLIKNSVDMSYLKWLLDQDINDRLRSALRTRVSELRGELDI
jgi:hypothetical protein